MCHADRALLHDWLTTHGGTVDDADASCGARWSPPAASTRPRRPSPPCEPRRTPRCGCSRPRPGGRPTPSDPRLTFELAEAHDAAGKEREAIRWYDEALGLGLREPHRHRALIQKARACGTSASSTQAAALAGRPGRGSARAAPRWRPSGRSCGCDAGESGRAVADLIEALLAHAGDADDDAYREVLHRFARCGAAVTRRAGTALAHLRAHGP